MPDTNEGRKTMENYELSQLVDQLKAVNDKLLHKYIAEVVNDIWGDTLAMTIIFVLIIPLGILANLKLGLGWPVIIVFWICLLCIVICNIINAYPLSKACIINTPAHALRENLLKFSWRDKVFTAISLIVLLGVFIWLAFELQHALNTHFLFGIEIQNKISIFAFWATLMVGFTCILISFIHTYVSISGLIMRLVADIDELNCNKE